MKPMKIYELADGSSAYITMDREAVDAIAYRYYGTNRGTTELLFEANPALSELPLLLPAGVTILLPKFIPPPVESTQINLWD